MRLHPKLDKEALIAKLKKQGLSNAQIQYAVNDEEKRGDLSKTSKEIRDMKRTVQHEQTVTETSSKDPTTVIGTARTPDGRLRRTKVRKDFVKGDKPMHEDLETVLTELVEAGYSDDQILEMIVAEAKIDRRKVGKVKLTPGKPMTKKQYAEMKSKAMSRKKVKPVKKKEVEPEPEVTGLDLITQHPMNRQIRSVLSTIPKTEHKAAAVNWLTKAIKDHKDNHVQSFVSNPFETMKSILNDRPKKTGPSLPTLKFMGQK